LGVAELKAVLGGEEVGAAVSGAFQGFSPSPGGYSGVVA
jgi:hypothetical protein